MSAPATFSSAHCAVKSVQRLVQIHHQAVQAVGFAYRRWSFGDTGFSHTLWCQDRAQRRSHRSAASAETPAGCVSSTHRLDHRLDVGEQSLSFNLARPGASISAAAIVRVRRRSETARAEWRRYRRCRIRGRDRAAGLCGS